MKKKKEKEKEKTPAEQPAEQLELLIHNFLIFGVNDAGNLLCRSKFGVKSAGIVDSQSG